MRGDVHVCVCVYRCVCVYVGVCVSVSLCKSASECIRTVLGELVFDNKDVRARRV